MPYLRVADLLTRVRSYHEGLRDWCVRRQHEEPDPRVALLTELVGAREDRMQGGLAKIAADADDAILNTWLQFEPDAAQATDLDAFELGGDLGVEEALARATGFELTVQAIYARAAGAMVAPRVREFFRALADLHEARAKQLGRISQGLEDGGLS